MSDKILNLNAAINHLSSDVDKILSSSFVTLGSADPPEEFGVYLLAVDNQIVYAGAAIGSRGLRDRLLSKHLSGDDNHVIQAAYKKEFPDRVLRREHIRQTVQVSWIVIEDPWRALTVERLLIWLLQPKWNRK